jgi:hypothetical protein
MISIFPESAFVNRAKSTRVHPNIQIVSLGEGCAAWDRDAFDTSLLRRWILPGYSASRHRHKR